jgi:hypothetical protein
MKNIIRLLSLFTFAAFVLTSCEGPMGPAGKDANESCVMCHNAAKMDAIQAQYDLSDKGTRSARTGKYCARCHTTEGFKEITTMKTFIVSNEMLNGTKITCEACHKHSNFDFANSPDTVSEILRTLTPVYTNFNNFNYTSFAYANTNASDYPGLNNLCSTCHQYRGITSPLYSDPTPPPAGTIPTAPVSVNVKYTDLPYFPIANVSSNELTTTVKYRAGTGFGIHEGANQGDYLQGKNGYEYTGKTYTKTWKHSAASCTDCHFNAYDATSKTGGHTMKVNISDPTCVACHDLTAKRATTLAGIQAKLTELGDLLAARKVFKKTTSGTTVSYSAQFSHDFYGNLLPTTTSTTKYALTLTTANIPSLTTGLLTYNKNVAWATDADFANRIGREWKYGELGAAWNFTYVNTAADAANIAVHNPTYALQLLQTSIDWLKAN